MTDVNTSAKVVEQRIAALEAFGRMRCGLTNEPCDCHRDAATLRALLAARAASRSENARLREALTDAISMIASYADSFPYAELKDDDDRVRKMRAALAQGGSDVA